MSDSAKKKEAEITLSNSPAPDMIQIPGPSQESIAELKLPDSVRINNLSVSDDNDESASSNNSVNINSNSNTNDTNTNNSNNKSNHDTNTSKLSRKHIISLFNKDTSGNKKEKEKTKEKEKERKELNNNLSENGISGGGSNKRIVKPVEKRLSAGSKSGSLVDAMRMFMSSSGNNNNNNNNSNNSNNENDTPIDIASANSSFTNLGRKNSFDKQYLSDSDLSQFNHTIKKKSNSNDKRGELSLKSSSSLQTDTLNHKTSSFRDRLRFQVNFCFLLSLSLSLCFFFFLVLFCFVLFCFVWFRRLVSFMANSFLSSFL